MISTINMTPEDRLELDNSLRKASEILYRYSNADDCESFAHLENHVRHQILEFVSPQLTLFLSRRKQIYHYQEGSELLKVV
jgi:hypothetical protein